MLSDRDRKVCEAYLSAPEMSEPRVATELGISRYEVRGSLDRGRRAGMNLSKPRGGKKPMRPIPKIDSVSVTITNLSNASIDETISHRSISLPRLSFAAGPAPAEIPLNRKPRVVETKPQPQLTEREIFLLKRLVLIKQVHQEGLRRGLFRIHSR